MWAKDSNNIRNGKKENIFRVNFYVDDEKLKGEVENFVNNYFTRLISGEIIGVGIITNLLLRIVKLTI